MPQNRLPWIITGILILVVGWLLLTRQGVLTVKVQPSGLAPLGQVQTGPTPTPTPTSLREGKDTYTISQAANTPGPKISSLTLDPLDPKVNQQQILTAHIAYDQAVSNVSIELTSDNKTRTLPLVLASGTATNGDWQTTWTVDDTVLYKYILNITATSGVIRNTVQVAPRQ